MLTAGYEKKADRPQGHGPPPGETYLDLACQRVDAVHERRLQVGIFVGQVRAQFLWSLVARHRDGAECRVPVDAQQFFFARKVAKLRNSREPHQSRDPLFPEFLYVDDHDWLQLGIRFWRDTRSFHAKPEPAPGFLYNLLNYCDFLLNSGIQGDTDLDAQGGNRRTTVASFDGYPTKSRQPLAGRVKYATPHD
jgi:hypothetical protein